MLSEVKPDNAEQQMGVWVHLFRSPASPGSSSFSSAELRLVMSSVKKLVSSIPETGEVYMLFVQSLSSKF